MELLPSILQSLVIFIAWVAGLLIYILPQGKRKQNLPFSLFLFLIGLHLLTDLTISNPIFDNTKIHLIPSIFTALYGPLIYFHAHHLLTRELPSYRAHVTLPAIFLFVYMVFGYVKPFFVPVFGVQYAVYTFLIYRLVKEDNERRGIKAKWILFSTYSFGAIWLFAFAAIFCGEVLGIILLANALEMFSFVMVMVFVFTLLYFMIIHSNLFMDVKIARKSQYLKKSELSDQEIRKMEELKTLFERDKLYNIPEINREDLAARLGLDVQTLSKQVNQYFKMNLSELINKFRIEESCLLLTKKELTIKEIYFEVGFVSRSAFNTSFKKHVGKTPSEYRKTL